MRRPMTVLAVLALVVAACGDDDATTTVPDDTGVTTTTAVEDGATTTTEGVEETTTTTTTTTEAPRPPGAAFILKGETGSYVTALQVYLDCAGYGPVVIDGVFGDGTAGSVEEAQADEGKEATGEPDEETFANLSRECDRARDVVFASGATTAEVAGNAAPGDDEVFNLRVLEGQQMTVQVYSHGIVDVAIQGADGAVLHRPDGSTEIVVDVPTSQMYALRVSAGAPVSYSLAISVPPAEEDTTTTTEAQAAGFYLASDGFNEIDFGEGSGRAITTLTESFGPPSEDTDWFAEAGSETYPCAEQARVVTWLFPGTEGMMSTTLEVVFHDLFTDDPVFAQWRYYLTWGYDDTQPESGFLSTAHGLSAGDDYTEAVSYGFLLGGFEEPSEGLLDGIRVSIATNGGTYADDGQVLAMQAGTWYCESPDV